MRLKLTFVYLIILESGQVLDFSRPRDFLKYPKESSYCQLVPNVRNDNKVQKTSVAERDSVKDALKVSVEKVDEGAFLFGEAPLTTWDVKFYLITEK